MIGVLTHHWPKPERFDDAQRLLENNGLAQSRFGGFGTRQTMIALSAEPKITTLVTWESEQIYEAWRASPEREVSMAGANALWAKPPESERFRMMD